MGCQLCVFALKLQRLYDSDTSSPIDSLSFQKLPSSGQRGHGGGECLRRPLILPCLAGGCVWKLCLGAQVPTLSVYQWPVNQGAQIEVGGL